MDKNTQSINNISRADWVYFGVSYLDIAQLACSEMLKNKGKGTINNEFLYIATIYNIKHAIEILEKLLLVTLQETGKLNRDQQIHDTKQLLNII